MNVRLKNFLIPVYILVTTLWLHTTFAVPVSNPKNSSDTPSQGITSVKPNPYDAYNQNSINPIPEPQILFRKRIWREIYLKERKNQPFFSRGHEITKFIIEGVKAGKLQPYTDDTFTKEMTLEEFFEKLRTSNDKDTSTADLLSQDSGWGTQHTTRSTSQEYEDNGNYFAPNEITTLEMMEDLIFDKVAARFVCDIQAITMIIPAYKIVTGLRKSVATFKYKDLAVYLDNTKEAIWFNVKNNAGNIKMTEAIALRKFDSRIVKIDNPSNATVEDIYPKASLQGSKIKEEELIELDWFMWEN